MIALKYNQIMKNSMVSSSCTVASSKSVLSIDEKREMIRRKGSSLDVILKDAKRVQAKLNTADNDKLNEYLESVRDIEITLAKEEAWLDKPKPEAPLKEPKQGLEGYQEIKMMNSPHQAISL